MFEESGSSSIGIDSGSEEEIRERVFGHADSSSFEDGLEQWPTEVFHYSCQTEMGQAISHLGTEGTQGLLDDTADDKSQDRCQKQDFDNVGVRGRQFVPSVVGLPFLEDEFYFPARSIGLPDLLCRELVWEDIGQIQVVFLCLRIQQTAPRGSVL